MRLLAKKVSGHLFICCAIFLLVGIAKVPVSAEVRGEVVDQNGFLVQQAEVIAEDLIKGVKIYARSDLNGNYRLSLGTSRYAITFWKTGFCTNRRAPIEISSKTSVTVNARLITCTIETRIVLGDPNESGVIEKYIEPFKRDLVTFQEGMRLYTVWIEYGTKDRVKSKTIYKAFQSPSGPVPVRLTFNHIQIFASEITSVGGGKFILQGSVEFADGSSVRSYRLMHLALQNGKAKLLRFK